MSGSISIESRRCTSPLLRSVCVVSPDPNPMLATRAGCGCMLSGIAAASTMVLSSTVASPGPIWMPASGLPLVAIVTVPSSCTRLIVAVLPSRR